MKNSRRAVLALSAGLLSGCGESERPPAIAGYFVPGEAGKIGVANVCRVYQAENGQQISAKLRLVHGKERSWLSQTSSLGVSSEVAWGDLGKPAEASELDNATYAAGVESVQDMPCVFNIGKIALEEGAPGPQEGIYHLILNKKNQVEQIIGPAKPENTVDTPLMRYDVELPGDN